MRIARPSSRPISASVQHGPGGRPVGDEDAHDPAAQGAADGGRLAGPDRDRDDARRRAQGLEVDGDRASAQRRLRRSARRRRTDGRRGRRRRRRPRELVDLRRRSGPRCGAATTTPSRPSPRASRRCRRWPGSGRGSARTSGRPRDRPRGRRGRSGRPRTPGRRADDRCPPSRSARARVSAPASSSRSSRRRAAGQLDDLDGGRRPRRDLAHDRGHRRAPGDADDLRRPDQAVDDGAGQPRDGSERWRLGRDLGDRGEVQPEPLLEGGGQGAVLQRDVAVLDPDAARRPGRHRCSRATRNREMPRCAAISTLDIWRSKNRRATWLARSGRGSRRGGRHAPIVARTLT